ncbi:MAG: hypothetical protein A3D92_20850 [Bacteroidetes bacterium RIFCSPHIGHO2_02_FULL_44_7]|nr:MAG: hypothetical protein A3D92_20850 [Bacteroidetes bacterium RIFCSPHIGHO2_02_FULL_44_7]
MKKEPIVYSSVLLVFLLFIGANQLEISNHDALIEARSITALQEDTLVFDDLLEIVNTVNGEGMPKPPTEFRKGHVTPTTTNASVTKTADGFVVQLPSSNGVPTPTIDNGKLYVSGGFGSKQYFCFDGKTGDKVWGVDLDDDGPSSGVIEDGVLVYNTESCTIFATDAKSGEQLWSYYLGDPLMSTPTVANGLVFTAFPAHADWSSAKDFKEKVEGKFFPSHVLIAMDLKTGAIKWEKWIDGDVISAPVADEGKLHVVSFPGTYFVLDQKTGVFESAKRLRGTSAPTLTRNGMVISRRSEVQGAAASESIGTIGRNAEWSEKYKRAEAQYLDVTVQNQSGLKGQASNDDAGNGFAGGAPASSGADRASMNVGQSNVSTLQAYTGSRTLNFNGNNYNTMGDSLVCTDEISGTMKWTVGLQGDLKTIGGFLGTPPIRVGNDILIATYLGNILLIDAETGQQKKKYSTGENIRTSPVAMDGWIYVGTANGKVIAINTNQTWITGWPMLGKNPGHTNG